MPATMLMEHADLLTLLTGAVGVILLVIDALIAQYADTQPRVAGVCGDFLLRLHIHVEVRIIRGSDDSKPS